MKWLNTLRTFKNQKGVRLYQRLLQSLRPYLWVFIVGMVATILGSLLDAGLTWLVKPIVEQGFVNKNEVFIRLLPLGVIIVLIARGTANFGSTYCLSRVGRMVVADFRKQLFSHLLHLPAKFYDRHTSGQLLSLIIYNTDQIAQATTDALLTLLQEGFFAIGLVIVMLSLSWKLSILILILTPLMTYIIKYTSRRLRRISGSVQESMGSVTHVAEEAIEGYKVIRTFGGEDYEDQKFKKVTNVNRQREMKMVVTDTFGNSLVQLLTGLPIAVILYLATLPSLDISAGSFAAIIAAIISFQRPLRRLTRVNSMIQKGISAAESIYELLDQEKEKDHGTKSLDRAKGAIEYQHICFNYPHRDEDVLHDINFTIQPGELVALVGRSGSGKSTLVSLLPRFYDALRGKILMDGIDIQQYRLQDLRRQFALVSQHITLFNDTIAHNIAYGRFSDAVEQQIIEAAKAAYALDFIEKLPQGLQTIVGENGVLLSGGQRQRLAIARAILKNAPILILDEATSSLDTESERYIQAAIDQLIQHRTTLVIAHRLSTVEHADRILVLDQGRIVETGTHQQLLELNGHYARLYAMQFKDE